MWKALLVVSVLTIDTAHATSMVTSFWFNNLCDYDVDLADWGATIPAGKDWNIYWKRNGGAPYHRISFRFKGDTAWDFIETNGAFMGQGSYTAPGHWSFSSYNGFNMGSMYEAWHPTESKYACRDPGAVANFDGAWAAGVCTGGNGYSCQGSNACGTAISNFIRDNSWVIKEDFTWERMYSGGIVGQFWCDEKHGFPPSWVTGGVATLSDCIDNSKPFKLVVTTCPERRQSSTLNSMVYNATRVATTGNDATIAGSDPILV